MFLLAGNCLLLPAIFLLWRHPFSCFPSFPLSRARIRVYLLSLAAAAMMMMCGTGTADNHDIHDHGGNGRPCTKRQVSAPSTDDDDGQTLLCDIDHHGSHPTASTSTTTMTAALTHLAAATAMAMATCCPMLLTEMATPMIITTTIMPRSIIKRRGCGDCWMTAFERRGNSSSPDDDDDGQQQLFREQSLIPA